MADNAFSFQITRWHSVLQLIFSLVIIIVVGFLTSALIIAGVGLLLDISFEEMLKIPSPGAGQRQILILKFVQVTQQIAMFLVPSLIIARLYKDGNSSFLRTDRYLPVVLFLILVILSLLVIPVTTYTGYLNSGISLPERFSNLSEWIRSRQNEADRMTSLMIASGGLMSLSVNILIMAVIPAVAEEFLFRGVIQQLLIRVVRSYHAGIWLSAIIFSCVHLQFYGFIPRLILGLLYGYLFYWSGNLWVAVTAHFANNAFLVALSYIRDFGPGSEDMSTVANINPGFPFIPVLLSGLLLYYLWNYFRRTRDII
jgi:hypothetical protein